MNLDKPVTHPLTRRWALPGALLCSAGSLLFAAPANAAPADTTLYAAEVFAWEGDPVTTSTCDAQVSLPGMADAADLPAGSTAAVDVRGPLQQVTGDANCRTWMIGGIPVAAPFSADPQLAPGTVVRAVGSAAVAPSTEIVAERIRSREEQGVGAAEVTLLYQAQMTIVQGDLVLPGVGGGCVTVASDAWTVRDEAGQTFGLDVSAARTAGAIDPCTAPGDSMGVQFDLAPIAEAAPPAGGPVLFDPATGTGVLAPVTGALAPVTGALAPVTGALAPVTGILGGLSAGTGG